jgi:uncharacterized SAM-dependent methyltransferase
MSEDRDRLWVASMPDSYQRWLAPSIFTPFAADLARRASRLGPRRVLELAAGTGVLTGELVAVLPEADRLRRHCHLGRLATILEIRFRSRRQAWGQLETRGGLRAER